MPGDLVIVMTGETFRADGIVLTAADLQIDESSLTGAVVSSPEAPRDCAGARQ